MEGGKQNYLANLRTADSGVLCRGLWISDLELFPAACGEGRILSV